MTNNKINQDDLEALLETLDNEMKRHEEESKKLNATLTHLNHLKDTHEELE